MSRVGHANYETTMVYTHKLKRSEGNTVQALNNFVENNAFHFLALQKWSCKYSQKIYSLIEESYKLGKLELSLDEFKHYLGISSSYQPRHISGNIIPKIQQDMLKHYPNFQCQSI